MFDGVEVINFPYSIEDGEKEYPLFSGAVVRDVVKNIPQDIRPAIVLDYEKIPQKFFDEHQKKVDKMGTGKRMTPEELEAAERKLAEIFFDEKVPAE